MGKYIRFLMLGAILVGCTAMHVPKLIEHQGNKVNINDGKSCRQCHTDLADHSHPVMVAYPPPGREGKFAPIGKVRESGILLLDGKVSCVSCHDLTNSAPFHPLKQFHGSQLCLVCHLK